MKELIVDLTEKLKNAFEKSGYTGDKVRVIKSNRPDLCMYQCNAALALAKEYKKKPIDIANEVVDKLDRDLFTKAEAVMPGFINLDINTDYFIEYINKMYTSTKYGFEESNDNQKVMIDYGGANVAKPLHVGHLRTAVIGESIKRILRFDNQEVIGDVHLGDWGLQMGLIITEVKSMYPDLPYFNPDFNGEYPKEAPFTITELEKIYPRASEKSKIDDDYKEEARQATYELQNGNKGYYALWEHILNVSLIDLKKNYDRLNVEFDLWKKESDAQKYIPDMVKYLKDNGYTRISEGALVVDVKRDDDTREVPPCMILKSNGATLYNTTDLATLVERRELFNPTKIIYVVDKRQELYFEQVFRCAKKTKIIGEDVKLIFHGFGTMNGKDGKPFKTRDGGVMRLENLLEEVKSKITDKLNDNENIDNDKKDNIAEMVTLAAIKFGDLSNQAIKDYIFDIERFTSFDGETGPYILYTIVRIKSILAKVDSSFDFNIMNITSKEEFELIKKITEFSEVMRETVDELAPHKLCKYTFEVANEFNSMYHTVKILSEKDDRQRNSYLSLCKITKLILETCIDLLGFEAPDRM